MRRIVTPADLPNVVPTSEGWMHDVELAVLVGFVIATDADRVLEIGSYKGRTTSALLNHTPGSITTVDNFKGPTDEPEVIGLRAEFDRNVPKHPRLKVLVGDSAKVMADLGSEGYDFDLILIDGDHRTPGVRADVVAAWPLLRENGYMFFDDIDWDSVLQGIGEAFMELGLISGPDAPPFIFKTTNKLGYCRKVGGKPCIPDR